MGVRRLLESRADPTLRTSMGWTAYDCAAEASERADDPHVRQRCAQVAQMMRDLLGAHYFEHHFWKALEDRRLEVAIRILKGARFHSEDGQAWLLRMAAEWLLMAACSGIQDYV